MGDRLLNPVDEYQPKRSRSVQFLDLFFVSFYLFVLICDYLRLFTTICARF